MMIMLSACALRDVPVTAPPVISLAPMVTPVFVGTCDDNKLLEAWLQSAGFGSSDFMEILEAAAALNRADSYESILQMIGRREQLSRIPVPDCAIEAHLLLIDALSKAVEVFVAYNNGDRADLGAIIEDTRKRLDMVKVIELELTDRLEQQYSRTP